MAGKSPCGTSRRCKLYIGNSYNINNLEVHVVIKWPNKLNKQSPKRQDWEFDFYPERKTANREERDPQEEKSKTTRPKHHNNETHSIAPRERDEPHLRGIDNNQPSSIAGVQTPWLPAYGSGVLPIGQQHVSTAPKNVAN